MEGSLSCISYNEIKNEVALGDSSGEIKVFSASDANLVFLD
jgi:hypothetical protein